MTFRYRKKWWKKVFSIKFLAFFALFVVVIAVVVFDFNTEERADNIKKENFESVTETKEEVRIENNNSIEGEVDIPSTDLNSESEILSSENYRISQVHFGGSVVLLENEFDSTPIEISFNRAETFIVGDKDESKLVITWKTNKPAISEIEYSKNNGQNPVVIQEKEYGVNHNVTIGGLDQGTAYSYRIRARDRWNNEAVTNYIGIYTSKKEESVFDLIARAIEDVFGWALRK